MKILFICTHNRCRSILAEAIFNHYSQHKFIAKSAGSQPAGEIHPLSLTALSAKGIPVDGLQSQSWDDHEDWQPDVVITVCDSAAGEQCPVWFGQSTKTHWGLNDPSSSSDSDALMLLRMFELIELLTRRAKLLATADLTAMTTTQLSDFLNGLGA